MFDVKTITRYINNILRINIKLQTISSTLSSRITLVSRKWMLLVLLLPHSPICHQLFLFLVFSFKHRNARKEQPHKYITSPMFRHPPSMPDKSQNKIHTYLEASHQVQIIKSKSPSPTHQVKVILVPTLATSSVVTMVSCK